MTAISRTSELVLALLLAAATAAADVVITAEEVMPCSVELADASFLSLRLPQGGTKTLNTRDVYEVRIRDSSRVVEIAARLPQVRVVLDSGQAVPPPAARNRDMLRLRLDWARRASAGDLFWYSDVIDTLARDASPNEMVAKCEDMDIILSVCGRSDETVAGLLREVSREEKALRRIWPRAVTSLVAGACCALPGGMAIGYSAGIFYAANDEQIGGSVDACMQYGCAAGSLLGAVAGATVGTAWRDNLIARHRNRVNDLVRRVNGVLTSAP